MTDFTLSATVPAPSDEAVARVRELLGACVLATLTGGAEDTDAARA